MTNTWVIAAVAVATLLGAPAGAKDKPVAATVLQVDDILGFAGRDLHFTLRQDRSFVYTKRFENKANIRGVLTAQQNKNLMKKLIDAGLFTIKSMPQDPRVRDGASFSVRVIYQGRKRQLAIDRRHKFAQLVRIELARLAKAAREPGATATPR